MIVPLMLSDGKANGNAALSHRWRAGIDSDVPLLISGVPCECGQPSGDGGYILVCGVCLQYQRTKSGNLELRRDDGEVRKQENARDRKRWQREENRRKQERQRRYRANGRGEEGGSHDS